MLVATQSITRVCCEECCKPARSSLEPWYEHAHTHAQQETERRRERQRYSVKHYTVTHAGIYCVALACA